MTCFADLALLTEGKGAEDWVAWLGHGDTFADFLDIAGAYEWTISFCLP